MFSLKNRKKRKNVSGLEGQLVPYQKISYLHSSTWKEERSRKVGESETRILYSALQGDPRLHTIKRNKYSTEITSRVKARSQWSWEFPWYQFSPKPHNIPRYQDFSFITLLLIPPPTQPFQSLVSPSPIFSPLQLPPQLTQNISTNSSSLEIHVSRLGFSLLLTFSGIMNFNAVILCFTPNNHL